MIVNWTRPVVALVAAGIFGGFADGQPAQAQSLQHIDRLAMKMQQEARGVLREVRHHLRNTPQYRHLYNDVSQMYQLTAHIHELVHDGASLQHMRADVSRLDELFHHVEELLDTVQRSRLVSQEDLQHVRAALNEMGETLHHLQDDLKRVRDRR